jgi:hypothetical protein
MMQTTKTYRFRCSARASRPVSTKCDIMQLTTVCNPEVDMETNAIVLMARLRTLQLVKDPVTTWLSTLNTLHDVQEFP